MNAPEKIMARASTYCPVADRMVQMTPTKAGLVGCWAEYSELLAYNPTLGSYIDEDREIAGEGREGF